MPVVPPSAGPRVLVVLLAAVGVLGLAFLVFSITWGAAALADDLGVADRSTARVTAQDLRSQDPYSRGCKQHYDYDVAWDDREGHFSVCLTSDPGDLADLEVGDEVEIASVPWSSTVSPEGESAEGFAWVALLVGVLVPVWSAVSIRRYRRLTRGGLTGTLVTGTVRRGRLATAVDTGERRLVLLAVKEMRSLADGDPAEVWSTRRSWIRRRPAGPWVLRSRGQVGAFTHAWWRKTS